MIINSITLDNFKSHKHSHIELNEGISLILGSNGAGKSSIFEAISYAFFKTFDGKLDDLIRKPINENNAPKEMKVTVEFENDGNHYKLERGKKSSSTAKLYIKENGRFAPLCNGDRQVTSEIEKRLGLEAKSFKNAVYIKQGEITELIEKTPAEKKEFIGKLLNIDSLEIAYGELKPIIDEYEKQKSENNGKLDNKEYLEKSKEDLKNAIKENKSKLEEYIEENDKIKNELNTLLEKVTESDKNKNKYETLKSQITQQQKIISHFEEQKEKHEQKLKNIEELERENVELEKYSKKLPHLKELKEYENEKNNLMILLETVTSKIDDINDNKKSLEENKEFSLEFDKINEEIETLTNKRKILEKEVNNNQKIKIEISRKSETKEDILIYIRKTSEYASKIFNRNFNNPEEVEKTVLEEKEKTENNKRILEDKIKSNDEELFSKRNELKNIRKSLENLENTKDTCPICQSPISHEKHKELSKKYYEDISNIELRIEELETANKKQEVKVKEFEIYLEKIDNINISKLKDQYTEFNKLINEIKDLNKLMPKVEEDEAALNNIDKQINERRNHQKSIESKRNSYLVAKNNLEKIDVEEIEFEKKDVDSKLNEIKAKCHDLIIRYGVGDNLNQTLKFTETQVDTYKKNQTEINNKNDILKENEYVINNLNKERLNLKNFEDEINNLDYDEEDNKKLHDTYISQQEKYEKVKTEITIINVEIEKDTKTLGDKKKELDELEEVSKEQEHLNDYINLLNKIRELYSKDGVQKDLREAARPEIERRTMDIFNDFDFDYSTLKIDSGYEITVMNKNEELNLDMMSGGEKIVIALALRLGIAQVVSKNRTEMLLLDEPTIHLDAERRDSLIEIIGYTSIVPQMIVVTHDEGMEALSNNIIKIRKENGISFVDNS